MLIGAVVLFMVGMIQTLGYNGTTSLQPVLSSSGTWTSFNGLFSPDQDKGSPYKWLGSEPKVNNSLVNFDKRLIRVLSYTAKRGDTECVWNGTHENLTLSIESSMYSDLITAPYKQRSISTLYRGTGVRITSADEVKCTIEPSPSAFLPVQCPVPTVFDSKPISLLANGKVLNDKPYDTANCQVKCAVDFYPDFAAGSADITAPIITNSVLRNLNPTPTQADFFRYEEITQKTRDASVYKTAQLMYEIMKIDEPNCEKRSGNKGGEKAIPITMIAPNWIRAKLGDDWQKLMDLAKNEFRFTFQDGSPLAGLSSDPNLDNKGLQINF